MSSITNRFCYNESGVNLCLTKNHNKEIDVNYMVGKGRKAMIGGGILLQPITQKQVNLAHSF